MYDNIPGPRFLKTIMALKCAVWATSNLARLWAVIVGGQKTLILEIQIMQFSLEHVCAVKKKQVKNECLLYITFNTAIQFYVKL